MSIKISKLKLLIVEGRDEENFFTAAFTHLNLADIQVLAIGGKTNLGQNLKALTKDAAFASVQCLAVVRDADLTPAASTTPAATSAFDSVRAALTAQGLACPPGHGQFAPGPPRVGIFIVPDGTNDGMLETLCLGSVAVLPEYHCLADYLNCLGSHGVVPNNLHKARAHAWLASRPEADKRVGEAALAGYWLFADAAFGPLWTFLQSM